MPTCHTCGRALPNRYAIGKTVEEDGQVRHYCHLHSDPPDSQPKKPDTHPLKPAGALRRLIRKMTASRETKQAEAQQRKGLQQALAALKQMGQGASALIARLRKAKSPEEIEAEIQNASNENRNKRNEVSARLESLHHEIASGKRELKEASPARKRILEMELRAKLKEYQSAERTLGILLENDQALSLVTARMEEVAAYGMSGLSAEFVENLTDRLDEATDEAEDRTDLLRDLERAGRRRDRTPDTDDLLAELEAFGEAEPDDHPAPEPHHTSEPTKTRKDPLDDFSEPER